MITAATATKNINGNVDLDVESHPVMFALNISLPAIGNSIATAIRAITIPMTNAVSPDTPALARRALIVMCLARNRLAFEFTSIAKISRSHDWNVVNYDIQANIKALHHNLVT